MAAHHSGMPTDAVIIESWNGFEFEGTLKGDLVQLPLSVPEHLQLHQGV